jgi:hypothetical protein
MFVTASVTFHQLPFARCSGYSEAKFKLVTAVTKQSTTNGNSVQLHAQNVTPFQVIVFLCGMYQSLGMSL